MKYNLCRESKNVLYNHWNLSSHAYFQVIRQTKRVRVLTENLYYHHFMENRSISTFNPEHIRHIKMDFN